MKKSFVFNALVATAMSLGAHSVFAAEHGPTPTPTPKASDTITVDIKNAKGESVGTAWVSQKDKKGLTIKLDLHGLTAGTHGIHIHEKGSCIGPDFKSAGGHFSPDHKKHGHVAGGEHEGDLPNVEVGADGTVKTTIEDDHANLGSSLASLQKGTGTSIVVHAKADDYKTQPSGDSGDRVACGVIAAEVK